MNTRYLHVLYTIDPRSGGPAEGVKQLTRAARRLGHDVEIAVLAKPASDWMREYDCAVHYMGPSYLKYGYSPRLAGWLRGNVKRFSAVVVNGIWQYQSLCTWSVLAQSRVPYYVFTHGMLDPWFKKQYPLKHLKKLMYWPWAEYRVLRDARAVLFTSEDERLLARQSFKMYRARERVVNYGVPEPAGESGSQVKAFLDAFPHLREKRFLLFLGRLHPKKGCDILIEAFASALRREPSLHLVMAGPDQLGIQRGLQGLAARRGVAHAVTWPGMLQGDKKFGAFRAADAFVLPSHQENFGIVVAEALACGTPVLLSRKVNTWREVVSDNAGFGAEDTLEGVTALLHKWLDLNPETRARMASAARKCFSRHFHIDAAATSLLALIDGQVPEPALA